MKMNDTIEINAAPTVVYAALLDPQVLLASVPGASRVTGTPDDGYDATVTQKVGPVKATFKGRVTMSDMVKGECLTISGEGRGRTAGYAKGDARVTFASTETGGTLLSYDVEARVGGKLAQLGSRIIDGFARKMADRFFRNLRDMIEGPDEADDEGADDEPPPEGLLGRLTGRN
ncbi:MAG: carbon monoxide dehydrogenase subunit G [Rhodobacteraceae bacterium]|nr:carbon monoxide dehydrogenase subunit G [Paracoccaceae bacterium]